MFYRVSPKRPLGLERRLFEAEDHLFRIEAMIGVMRLAATSEMLDDETKQSFTVMIGILGADCDLLRRELYGKEGKL